MTEKLQRRIPRTPRNQSIDQPLQALSFFNCFLQGVDVDALDRYTPNQRESAFSQWLCTTLRTVQYNNN
jgi:hypothetical protein